MNPVHSLRKTCSSYWCPTRGCRKNSQPEPSCRSHGATLRRHVFIKEAQVLHEIREAGSISSLLCEDTIEHGLHGFSIVWLLAICKGCHQNVDTVAPRHWSRKRTPKIGGTLQGIVPGVGREYILRYHQCCIEHLSPRRGLVRRRKDLEGYLHPRRRRHGLHSSIDRLLYIQTHAVI
jgi:hypothetical protein